MGVYIKGMEMPKNCINCAARHGAECWLTDCSYIPNYHKERPKWCPLVPVPPHGRLGDLDALHKLFLEKGKEYKGVGGAMVAAAAWCIANAPTILQAEEGE